MMSKRAMVVCGLCGTLSSGCTGPGAGNPDASNSSLTGGGSLAGTWNLTTTGMGGGGHVLTTLTIGQDSLSITSPDFTFSATRAGNALTFTDNDPPNGSNTGVLTATQTPSAFNAGIVPFNLGGSWTMQGGPTGGSPTVTCTLSVSPTEIDGACQEASPSKPWFSFAMQKTMAAASSFGDFGGHWSNTWTSPGVAGSPFPCGIDFAGNSITTCAGGAINGQVTASPLAGITATYDGANTVSGSAKGWAEFSAMR